MIKNVKRTSRYMSVISYISAAVMLTSAVFAGGLLCGCVNRGTESGEKDSNVNNNVQEQNAQTKDVKQLYTELYDIQDGQYVCQTDDFCITLPDNIKLEEYDLNGSAPNDIEKLWNVSMLPNGEISIQIQNRVIDIPESEEVLKQRFANNHEKNENPYSTGEYKITYFMKNLYPDFPPDYGIMGYRYMVEFTDREYKYVQEIPVSDTQTLRTVANINTSDESIKQSFIDTVQSIKTADIIKAAYDAMF